MTPSSLDQLLHLNQKGLIPGPEESESDFFKRVDYCLTLKESLAVELGLPDPVDTLFSQQLIEKASGVTNKLFDISTAWVPIIFSNHKLAFWHGGCAWIFQLTHNTPTGAFLQLREAFAASNRYLGIYQREELIAHESAHIGRMLFHEPKFEEMLAYRTSHSKIREWLGPIIASPMEAIIFAFSLLLSFSSDFLAAYYGTESFYKIAFLLKLPPLVLLVFSLGRLWFRHNQFSRCLEKLQKGLNDPKKANAVIYRLTDFEIIDLGKMHIDEIRKYAKKQQNKSLRWLVIYKSYFS